MSLDQELKDQVAELTIKCYESVRQILRCSSMAGRSYYLFSFSDVVRILQVPTRKPLVSHR